MQYLIATYWMWLVVALLAGAVVGYWLPWRRTPKGGIGRLLLGWGAGAFIAGLVVAVFDWLPQRAGLYLETLLLLSFWYAVGGLLAASLRVATSRTKPASAALLGSARPESSALAARAKAAVKSVQDEAASAKAVDEAEAAAAAKAAEEARDAAVKAAEDARVAVEAKAVEVMRAAAAAKAAKDEQLANEAKAVEAARLAAAAAKAAADARMAAEVRAAEEARLAAAAKAAQDARTAAEVKAAEEARLAAATKAVEDARIAAAAKAAEDARLAAAAKAARDARIAAEAKAAEEARVAAKAVEDARIATDAKAAEEAHATAAAKAAKDDHVAATAARADEGTLHPGSKPPGIAADDEADDLKLIKGIGPKNEKACHALGIYKLRQIADWTPDEAVWVGHHMAFPGRIEREHWIAQAKLLASGGDTEHSLAVKSGSLVVDDKADEPLDPAAAEIFGKSLPEPAAAVDGEGKHPGRRPYGLARAIGQADNLKRIRGIGPQNEGRLHKLGIWHFSQIAAWSDENVKWVGSYLAFSGRIHREKWIAQARELAAGKDP